MKSTQFPFLRKAACAALMLAATAMSTMSVAQSTIGRVSEASGMSVALPISVAGVATASVLAAASTMTVTAVEASAAGAEIVIEVLVDGALKTLSFTVDAASGFAVGVGTVLSSTVVAGGIILHEGSRAVWFLPDRAGLRLIYHERLTE
ncbi:MAG: hypothetical protein AAGA23_10980 [Pseudomonadota bacterium]